MTTVRYNILTNTDVRDQFIDGVKLLKNDFLHDDWPSTYDIFVIWHYFAMMEMTPPNSSNGRNAAHSGPSFLPWHRWMLALLENHMQRVLEDSNFGLPYWDWAADGDLPPSQQHTAPIWSNEYMGGTGDPITIGPFAAGSWQINIEQILDPNTFNPILVWTNRPLRRSLGTGIPDMPESKVLPKSSAVYDLVHNREPNAIYDEFPWNRTSNGFRNGLEGWIDSPAMHNLVHVWIGGDMGPSSSPNDPIFYLNHCNVDRIWAGWQEIHPNSQYLPNSDANSNIRGHRISDNLYPITTDPLFDPLYGGDVSPSDLLNSSSNYEYDTFTDLI